MPAGPLLRATQALGIGWPGENRNCGGRALCRFTTRPVICAVPVKKAGSFVGLTKPKNAWYPGGPNSTKNGGSPALTQASLIFVPSIVEVCSHPSPAGGTTLTPYLPGERFWMSARPFASVVTTPSPIFTMVPSVL